ncbi:MAG: hypothetical protein LBE56_00820 [Tannerella sp.]|jgi:hypothetical protein|nr:hypothetical protein [Tannerella sp.]
MQYPNPKIKFYKIRTFNEKLSVSFDFLRENWKQLLKLSLYLILPICLFQAFAMNSFMDIYFKTLGISTGTAFSDMNLYSIVINYLAVVVFLLLGSSMLYALVFTMMIEYERRDDRMMSIKMGDIRKPLIRNIGKLLTVYGLELVLILVISGVFGLLMGISSLTGVIILAVIMILVLVAILVLLMIPMNLFMPIYIFEEISFSQALKKSFRYGFSHFGDTFLVLLVFGFIANIVSSVTSTPWMIIFFIGQFFTLAEPESGLNASVAYQFVVYILGIIQSYGSYASLIIVAIAIAFQYFHIREKKEGITVASDIQNFEHL